MFFSNRTAIFRFLAIAMWFHHRHWKSTVFLGGSGDYLLAFFLVHDVLPNRNVAACEIGSYPNSLSFSNTFPEN